jgi:D-alanine--poly(phosphoribitol) ligase subunit 2
MPVDPQAAAKSIQNKIAELTGELGRKPRLPDLQESIPDSGLLDSAGLMSLMVWYEMEFGLDLEQEELTLANFGTVERMVRYLER